MYPDKPPNTDNEKNASASTDPTQPQQMRSSQQLSQQRISQQRLSQQRFSQQRQSQQRLSQHTNEMRRTRQSSDRWFSAQKEFGSVSFFHIPEEIDRRESVPLPHLQESEKKFFELVGDGDVSAVKVFLQESPMFNINCTDFQGVTALHIAVKKSNVEMVEFLLKQSNLDVRDCALLAVEQNEPTILTMILDRQKEINPELEFSPCIDSTNYADNTTPLILAAKCGHYEIIGLLIDRGHVIVRPHQPRCFCKQECLLLLQKQDLLNSTAAKLDIYKAVCNPAYICHTSSDPILTVFYLVRELRDLQELEIVFRPNYSELEEETQQFSVDLIGCCRSSQEVELVLNQKKGSKMKGDFLFPRLILAIDYKQKNFVAHRNIQQVLENTWLGDWYRWRVYHPFIKVMYVIPRIFMLPFIVFICIAMPRSALAKYYSIPLNKMLSSIASYIIFLILITIHSNMDKKGQRHEQRVSVLEIVVVIYVVSYICNSIRMCIMQGPKRFFCFMWNIYDLVMETAFVLTFLFWVAAFITVDTELNLERKYWHYLDPQLLAEGLFCIATVLAFIRILLICQLSYALGPMQVSLGKMLHDFAKYIVLFSIIIGAFTAGMCHLYEYYDGMKQIDPETGVEARQESSFVSSFDTFKVLFWGLFCMSSQEAAEVVIENLPGVNENDHSIINEHHFTEAVGYILFAVYMVLCVIVILNMLIATLSNTFQRVTDNVAVEWVFGRTQVNMSYITQTVLPPPFNLIPTGVGGGVFMGLLEKQKPDTDPLVDKEGEDDYAILMSQLVQRYFSEK